MALSGAVAACCGNKGRAAEQVSQRVRLGTIGLFGRHLKFQDPQRWVALHRQWGFRAADCPVPIGAPAEVVRDYAQAAEKADIVIGQVGASAEQAVDLAFLFVPAQAAEERIKKFVTDYRGKGVALVAISPNNPEALQTGMSESITPGTRQ